MINVSRKVESEKRHKAMTRAQPKGRDAGRLLSSGLSGAARLRQPSAPASDRIC
ncbi:hypothetical protein QE383_002529 [Pseudoxanthomonas winnipegensis]|jgi:hypothetical protein|uniref:Uncharacterized protein n=1 Tax=Pseudoxanthomonas winnipegensis TaxID=2480810 RepID=A0AAW8GEM9_9GAMM|nr:hypothetical protein [Pseudoxanthomonas winnipegensis]